MSHDQSGPTAQRSVRLVNVSSASNAKVASSANGAKVDSPGRSPGLREKKGPAPTGRHKARGGSRAFSAPHVFLRYPGLRPGLTTFAPSVLSLLALMLCAFSVTRAAEVVNTAAVSYVGKLGPVTMKSRPVRTLTGSRAKAVLNYFTDARFTRGATVTGEGQPLFISANAPGCNLDPGLAETCRITITSHVTGDTEIFEAVETGPDTGIFRIVAGVPTTPGAAAPGDGMIETGVNDSLLAMVNFDGTTSTTTILIDPSGVVFSSATGLPVAGVRVTLIDAATGAPALVFLGDFTTAAPNPVITQADGRYSFPAVAPGSYRLEILPPPEFTAPSKIAPHSLPPGHIIDAAGSYGGSFEVSENTGAVTIDFPLDPVSSGTLFVQKTASRSTAEIGDFVDFTVRVKSVSTVTLPGVAIVDRLPFGFVFVKKSARLDGGKLADLDGADGPELHFAIGAIAPGASATVRYRIRIGAGARQGDGINRAQAVNESSPRAVSNVATARVLVEVGVFTDRGTIFGKVFADKNRSRVQDAAEPGVPGVRLYIEDGSYVITDSAGKYSFYGIKPGTHIVKLDRTTLPPGAELAPLNPRHAGDGGSVFAEVKAAEMHKANFALANATEEIMAAIAKLRAAAERAESGEGAANLKSELNRDGELPGAADPRALPASGLLTPGVAVQPTAQDRTQSAGTFVLGGNRAGFPPASETKPAPVPTAPLENSLDAGADSFGFIDLKDRDTLPAAQTTVRVKSAPGAKVLLRVNGREIPASRVGKRVTLVAQGVEAAEFIGLPLEPGENTLELTQFDPFGNARGSQKITVIAPDKLGRIKITTPDDATADGRTPARIAVELVDAHGVPVTARTALTLDASLGKWLVEDINPREPGVQVFIEGGRAEYQLAPPVEPGESRVRISSGLMEADAAVSFLPELRPMIAAGVIEGAIHFSHLSAGALRPVNARDTFDNELRGFATHRNDGSAAGRAAFFLKGKISGECLLTAAYDSEKDTRDRLFRDIQPGEFYPVYGDASVKGFEAQSTGKLYVRIDRKKSYLLYGDFVTQTASEAQQLGSYSRSLNGVREHFETRRVRANAWASYDNTRQTVEELRANGTSGPYQFRTANGVVNSEKVEVLTRDRNNPGLIVKTSAATRFSDYEFEPLTGHLLFKAPVPSLDADLNPVSIRVTYEVEQAGARFWVYGADAQVKVSDRFEIGGAFARDENPLDAYGLYSGNALFKLDAHTLLFGEFAHSEDALLGGGNAERIELRHQSEKLFGRIFWGRADEQFKNPTAILTAGRTEAGAQIHYQFAKGTRAIVQAVESESHELGARRGVMAAIEQTLAHDIRLEIGGRYSNESRTAAGALTPAAAPNEVRSARVKLTLPVPWTDNAARAFGEYEQDLFDSEKRLAAIGGEYRVDAKTRLYVRHELISSLGGPFSLNSVQEQSSTVFGVESMYAKDAALFNEYRARDGITGREAEAAIGLRNAWTLAPGVRASATFERVAPVGKTAVANESTAITGALEFTGDPDWKGTARLELRTSPTVDSLLDTIGLAWKLDENWTALGKSVVYFARNKGPVAADQKQARVQAGLAWRQTEKDVWNALGKYEYRWEDGAPGAFGGFGATSLDGTAKRRVHIVSLDVNCQPSADWQLSGHYAGKLLTDDSNGLASSSIAHLLTGRATRDLGGRFDVGVNASALLSKSAVSYGIGPEIGCTLAENLRVAIGYNFSGFRDEDLTQEQYTERGFYIALRMKFDEGLFKRRRKEEAR